MLALVLTLALALYVFGPDAFSRFILDFSVPRRAVSLTKSEEVYRAVIWSSISFSIAYCWERLNGTIDRVWNWGELRTFFSGLNSDEYFRHNSDAWFHSLHCVLWMNVCLLWRLYVVVLLMSLILYVIIRFYARIRDFFQGDKLLHRWGLTLLTALVVPRIAPWHLYLSGLLVREKNLQIHVDVMTKSDKLFQGRLADKTLGADGSLVNIVLAEPKRFRREEYLEAKKDGNSPVSGSFWKPIPTYMFVIMGSEIATMNIRHVPKDVSQLKLDPKDSDLKKELDALDALVKTLAKHATRENLS
jgi:hypothetical protein